VNYANSKRRQKLIVKLLNFIIFFSVFFTIYGLVNYYIFIRGWQAIPRIPLLRVCYLGLFIVISSSFLFGRILERFSICHASSISIWIGSFWLAFMAYLFFGILFLDILRGLNHLFSIFPSVIVEHYETAKRITGAIVLASVTVIIIIGHLNALKPRITMLNLDVKGKITSLPFLNIVLVTDIHLGTIIRNARVENLVGQINKMHPDIVLFAGDIVDEDLGPVVEQNIGKTLQNIKSRYGVYACTGNHEYFGGVEDAVAYLEEYGIKFLRDSAVMIDNNFYVAGREDRNIYNMTGKRRKELSEILKSVDRRYPVILMDHQPVKLNALAESGVDIQFSGHTHNGQLWPFNYITGLIYELSWGFMKIDQTNFYVSCGFGTWGPPVRLGNISEIVNIRLNFSR
jgi:uncharacterized protein